MSEFDSLREGQVSGHLNGEAAEYIFPTGAKNASESMFSRAALVRTTHLQRW